jgi:hypothetical protein
MVDISTRNIITDIGLILEAMIFGHVCPNCKSEFETGMAHVRELGGYFPVCIDGYSMWEIGYCGQYGIDSTTQVYATYAGQHIFCSPTCYKAAKHADTITRNIANSTRRRKERRDAVRALRPDSICQYCHRPFRAKRIDAKYCSDNCRKSSHRARKCKTS